MSVQIGQMEFTCLLLIHPCHLRMPVWNCDGKSPLLQVMDRNQLEPHVRLLMPHKQDRLSE